ncbi:MAG: hypothetical protein ACI8RZ_007921, partial [Myxococcota bacterium]
QHADTLTMEVSVRMTVRHFTSTTNGELLRNLSGARG